MGDNILDFNLANRQGEAKPGDISAEVIRERLNRSAEGFIRWLFSGRAHISRGYARVGDIHGTPGASLSIALSGASVGLWHDHATDEGGDLITLYRACMGYNGTADFAHSLKEIAKEFFGDPVEVERSSWRIPPTEKIEQDKVRLGTKPRDDMIELGAPVASYKYFDTRGNVLASVTRYEPDGTRESKTFRPYCYRTIENKTKWVPGTPDVRPLYRLPEIVLAQSVVLVEGEGKADALAKIGIEATSAMQGARAPIEKTDWSVLAGKIVIIWPDNDEPGAIYASAAAAKLSQIGCRVRLIPIPQGKPPKWDAVDCVAEGSDAAALISTAIEIGAKSAGLYEYLDINQIMNLPNPRWLVAGLMVEEALGFIFGPPGCLKTFIALDMALSFASGQAEWWDRSIERSGAVIYISSEGQSDLKFRIQAWERHRKVSAESIPFYLIRQSINFMKAEDVGKLLTTTQAIADKVRTPVAAVFVDTVSRVLPGAKENLQEDMTLFVNACDALRQRFRAAVVGIHHTSRAGNMRGSTVIPAAGDFIIEVKREPGAMSGSIFAAKIKAGTDGWEQYFKVEKVRLDDGLLALTSLVVDPAKEAPKTVSGWPERAICQQILMAIDREWQDGRPWCHAINTSRAALTNISKRWHLDRKVVADMLATWTANGIIAEAVRDPRNHITGFRKLTDI